MQEIMTRRAIMKTYLFKFLMVVIVLSLVCFLFDAAYAESIGLKSGEDFRALQVPKARIGSGEKITPAVAVKGKAAIGKFETKSAASKSNDQARGKLERARIKLQLRETTTVSNNGVSTSSSVSDYSFDRPSAQQAVKPAVEMAPKVSTPKISKATSVVSTAKPVQVKLIK
jgi:hypothetical protein